MSEKRADYRWNRVTKTRFRQLYDQGLNDVELAREIGFSRTTIRNCRIELNLPPNYDPVTHLSEETKAEILNLYHEPSSIKTIGRKLSLNPELIRKYLIKQNLDTSMQRGQAARRKRVHYTMEDHAINLLTYLDTHGPAFYKETLKGSGVSSNSLAEFRTFLFDEIEVIKLKIGAGKASRYGGNCIFGDLSNTSIYSLRGDPRLVDFIANRLPVPKTSGTLRSLHTLLCRLIGKERAREVRTKLGFPLSDGIPFNPRESPLKFSKEDLIEWYHKTENDKQLAEALGVIRDTAAYWRNKFNLPPKGEVPS